MREDVDGVSVDVVELMNRGVREAEMRGVSGMSESIVLGSRSFEDMAPASSESSSMSLHGIERLKGVDASNGRMKDVRLGSIDT